jgi:excisionase family DNA binding protein
MSELIDISELASYLGVSIRTVRRMAERYDFPVRYRISTRCVRWRRSEVDAWLATRAERPHVIPEGISPDLLGGRAIGPRRRRAA